MRALSPLVFQAMKDAKLKLYETESPTLNPLKLTERITNPLTTKTNPILRIDPKYNRNLAQLPSYVEHYASPPLNIGVAVLFSTQMRTDAA